MSGNAGSSRFTHGMASQAFVIFISIVAVCFTLSMQTAGHDAHTHVTDYVPHMAMTIAMVIGLGIMIYFVVKPNSVRSNHVHPHHVRHTLHGRLALSSVVVFYIIGNFLDFGQFAAELSCWSAWSGCYRPEVRLSHRVVVLFHLVRVVFTGCEMLICIMFHHQIMRRRRLLLYGLAVVQAANMALWFDSLVNETFHHVAVNETPACLPPSLLAGGHGVNHSGHGGAHGGHGGGHGGHGEGHGDHHGLFRRDVHHGHHVDHQDSHAVDVTEAHGGHGLLDATTVMAAHELTPSSMHWNVTKDMLHCWDKTSSEYEWLKDCSTFLYAMLIEWALLVSESMVDWLFGCVPDKNEKESHEGKKNGVAPMSGIEDAQEKHQANDDDVFEERSVIETSLLQDALTTDILEDDEGGSDVEKTVEEEMEDKASRWHHNCSKIFVTLAALFNVGFCMVSILLFYSCESTMDAYAVYSDAFHIYSIFYFLFLIGLTVIGFMCCHGFDRPLVETSYFEYLLLACVIGPLFISTMRITGHQILTVSDSGDWMEFAYSLEEVLRICQAALQSVYYFYAKDVTFVIRHRHPSQFNRERLESERRRNITDLPQSFSRKIGLKDSLAVLAISNMILWVVESGILPLAEAPGQGHGHGHDEWRVLQSVMNPITLFYRFNSALLFFSIYRCIRKKYYRVYHH